MSKESLMVQNDKHIISVSNHYSASSFWQRLKHYIHRSRMFILNSLCPGMHWYPVSRHLKNQHWVMGKRTFRLMKIACCTRRCPNAGAACNARVCHPVIGRCSPRRVRTNTTGVSTGWGLLSPFSAGIVFRRHNLTSRRFPHWKN